MKAFANLYGMISIAIAIFSTSFPAERFDDPREIKAGVVAVIFWPILLVAIVSPADDKKEPHP